MKKIKITCKGSGLVSLDELNDFQGDLKEIERSELEKLKSSIIKFGFSFPVFIWRKYILDGHHRLQAVRQLIKEGYAIDKIPIVKIEAKDKKEAAKKLLQLNSHFAKIKKEGLLGFLDEYDLDIVDMVGTITLPDVDIDEIAVEFGDVLTNYDDAVSYAEDDELKKIIIKIKDKSADREAIKDAVDGLVKKFGLEVKYE